MLLIHLGDLSVAASGKQVIELKEKQVSDIMTPLDKVFMVDYNDKLDFDQLAKIMECGHSRYRCATSPTNDIYEVCIPILALLCALGLSL